jgi:hypothetical protein
MKKIICGSIAVLAIAATIVFNVNLNTQSKKLSDISLTNVEALADGESSGSSYDCCNTCKGNYCGDFYPADGSGMIKVYHK